MGAGDLTIIGTVSSILAGVMLLVPGFTKLSDRDVFRKSVLTYTRFPRASRLIAYWTIPMCRSTRVCADDLPLRPLLQPVLRSIRQLFLLPAVHVQLLLPGGPFPLRASQ